MRNSSNMKLIPLILSILFLNISICTSQDAKSTAIKQKHNHALGVNIGHTTGYGLSYRYMPRSVGVQLTFGAVSKIRNSTRSYGLALFYNILPREHASIFVYQGTNYIRKKELNGFCSNEFREVEYYNIGMGFAADVNLTSRLNFGVHIGYGMFNSLKYFTVDGGTTFLFKF